MKVVVTDGNNRVALAIIRALGPAGVEITCTEQAPLALSRPVSFASKYVHRSFVTPAVSDEKFVPAMLEIAKGHEIIMPVSTNLVFSIARHKDLFAKHGIRVPFADIDKINSANDKLLLVQKALSVGVPAPETFVPDGLDDALGTADKLGYPAVLKLRSDESLYLEPSQRYAIVNSSDELSKEYRRMSSLPCAHAGNTHGKKEAPLLQEYIRGKGCGFFCLMDNVSEPVAIFCHERIREYPAAGGPATLCRSTYIKEIVDYGIKLLKSLNWTGIAMVEFRKSRDNGKYYLMEINPRYWGSLPLATLAGVNFPLLHCKTAMTEDISAVTHYRENVLLKFIVTDMLSIYDTFRANCSIRELADVLLDYVFGRSIPDGIFDCDDPRPGLLYIKNRLLAWLNR